MEPRTSPEIRVLYVLAKAGRAVRKRTISQATARWNAKTRDRVLSTLEQAELICAQPTPPGFSGKRRGTYYWLTDSGLEFVEELNKAGRVKLPEQWRQQYGTDEKPELPSGGSDQHSRARA